MNIRVLVASAVALAVIAPTANALSVINADNANYTVKVMPKGGKRVSLAVKPGASATVDCAAGCKLSLYGKTRNVDGKVAKIWIKSGAWVTK